MSNNTNKYSIKTLIRMACVITDRDGEPVDPTELTFLIRNPRNIQFTYTLGEGIVREEEGIYFADYEVDEEGSWYYRWEVGGTTPVSDERELVVADSQFYDLKAI